MQRITIQKKPATGYTFTHAMLNKKENVKFVDERTNQLVATLKPGLFEIAATDAIQLSGVQFKGQVFAKNIRGTIKLTGGCHIDGGDLHAGKKIIIEGENTDIKNVKFETAYLKLDGGRTEETALCVAKSQFKVDYFDQKGFVALSEKSFCKCTHDERVSTINGRVVLIDSAIEADGQLHVTETAVVEAKGTQIQAQAAAPAAPVRFVAQAGVTAKKGMIINGMMLLGYKAALKSEFLKLTNALLELKDHAAAIITKAVNGLNEIIKLDGTSQLQAEDLYVTRKLRAKLGAKVLVTETVEIAPTADFKGKSAFLQAKKVIAKGPIKLTDMNVKADEFIASSRYEASGGVVDTVRFAATFAAQLKTTKQHVISTSEYFMEGDGTQNDAFVKLKKYPRSERRTTEPYALISEKAFTELQGESGIIGGEVYNMGPLKAVTTTERKNNKTRKKIPTIMGDKLILLPDSVVYGDDLQFKSEHVHQVDGVLWLKGMLAGEGTRFLSSGYTRTASMTLGYDKLVQFKSLATVIAKQLEINTARYSNGGLVGADTYVLNALINNNDGILLVHTATVNALHSKTGIVLTKNNFDNFLSLKNVQAGILAAAKSLFPGYANIVDLVSSGIGAGQSMYQLVQTCKQYAEYKHLRVHQIIKLIVQTKNVLSAGYSIASAGFAAASEFARLPQDLEKNVPLIVAQETWSLPTIKKIGRQMLSAGIHGAQEFLRSADGGYTETSLLSEDAAVAHPNIEITSLLMMPTVQLGVNVSNTSLTNVSAVAFAANKMNVTAIANTNLLLQTAPHFAMKARHNQSPGLQGGLIDTNYQVARTDIPKPGTLYMRNPSAKGVAMNVDGKLDVGGQGTIEMEEDISGDGKIHYRDHVKFKVG